MTLRQEATEIIWRATADRKAGPGHVLDALLDWLVANAERIAWDHDRAEDLQAMVAVLRADIA